MYNKIMFKFCSCIPHGIHELKYELKYELKWLRILAYIKLYIVALRSECMN